MADGWVVWAHHLNTPVLVPVAAYTPANEKQRDEAQITADRIGGFVVRNHNISIEEDGEER